MREIKFRAFDLDDKEMIEVSALDWSDGKIISLNYPNGKKYPNDEMGDRVSIMQYTGLKDKNGKEIYEGDILYVKEEGRYGGEFNIPVEYADNWGCFGCACIRAKEISHHSEVESLFTRGFLTRTLGSFITLGEMTNGKFEFEIIGNIYENPELIS